MTDNVNSPAHYTAGRVETIELIKETLGNDFVGYCRGNVLKYVARYEYKGGIEDLRKANWYLNRLIAHLDKE